MSRDTQDRGQAPLLEAARLWERTSSKGTTYLAGRLGGLKVLIMPRRDNDQGDHSHVLFVAQATSDRERRN